MQGGQGPVVRLRLEGALALVALAALGLVVLLGVVLTRATPVCYGTASAAPGLVVPGEVPEGFARRLAEQIVLLLYNVTPATVDGAYERVYPLAHPRFLRVFEMRSKEERQTMVEHSLSAQLALRATTTRELPSGDFQVEVAALRRLYAGDAVLRDEEVVATVWLRPVYPTDLNPYGLALVELTLSQPVDPRL